MAPPVAAAVMQASPPGPVGRSLVLTGTLGSDRLCGRVILVTGAGSGIGLEAAASLLDLGASVIVAEIDGGARRRAERRLLGGSAEGRVMVVETDVADAGSVERLVIEAGARFGRIDAVINNATVAPVGDSVWQTAVEDWDRSYRVNVRGPVLLARATLPAMIRRGSGTFVCVSSTGGPYLAAYETQKAAQVALAASLDAELAGSGVIAFTIGPGLVPTETANRAIERLAPRLGLEVDAFWALNQAAVISVEAAGAGFAAAIAMAERYAGQEISSTQALVDAGVTVPSSRPEGAAMPVASAPPGTLELVRQVRATLAEQAAGWKERSFFERQWLVRDFKQRAGMPVERWLETLSELERRLEAGSAGGPDVPIDRLADFYRHMGDLARGYVKDEREREEQLGIVGGWEAQARRLAQALGPPAS